MSKKPQGKGKDEEVIQSPALDVNNVVVLEANDNHQFIVDKNCARLSRLVKSVLNAIQSNTFTETLDVASRTSAIVSVAELIPRPAAATSASQDAADVAALAHSPHQPNSLPVVHLKFLSSTQLEKAVAFMYYKYKFDHEAEKKPQVLFPNPISTKESMEWIAIASLLQL